MAQSQIRIPTIEELYTANASPAAPFDPTKVAGQYATGMTLEDTIKAKTLDRQKAEEDLKKEIQAALSKSKSEKALSTFGANPSLATAYQASPEKGAEGLFKQEEEKIKNQKEDLRAANYVRQFYTDPSGKSFAILGKVDKQNNPIVVPLPGTGENQPFIKPTLPAAQSADLAGLEQVEKKLGRAKEIFDSYPRTNGDSPLVGAMDNLSSWFQERAGNPDALKTEFRTLVTNNINQQIKAITGAQLSEQEAKRIMKALPDLNLKEAAFNQRIQDALNITHDIIAEKKGAYSTSGYRNMASEPANGAIPGTPSNAGGLSPEKLARLQELRAKKAQGTLGR